MQEKYRWRTLWRFLTLFLGLLLVGFAVPVFGQVQEENSSPDGLPTDDAYLGETRQSIALQENLILQADFAEYSKEDDVFTAKGNVVLKAGGVELRSRFLEYRPAEQYLKVTDNVLLTISPYGDLIAEEVIFDLEKNRILSSMMRGLFLGKHKLAFSKFAINIDGSNANILRGTYTVCPVCSEEDRESGNTSILRPIWRLQFGRIIENPATRSVSLENVSFQISGLHIPIFFLPEIRVLGPTVKRQSGLLFVKGGGGKFGAYIGFPYFISLGDTTNLTLTPYIGTESSMLGVEAETIFKSGRAQIEALYKPQTNDKSDLISSNQISRFGVKGKHFYNIDEQVRWKNEWDFVSDPKFTKDYESLYKRDVSGQSPSKIRSEINYFSSHYNYGLIGGGVASNLYGSVPITSSYLESRVRYRTEALGGLDIHVDSFIREETYSWAHQEAEHTGKNLEKDQSASTQMINFSLNRPTKRFFANGMVFETHTRFDVRYKGIDGSAYQAIQRYADNGFLFSEFSENEESALSSSIATRLELSLPMERYVGHSRAAINPFVGITSAFRIFGKDVHAKREDWFFPNAVSLSTNEQTPYTSDMGREMRLLGGFEASYSTLGAYDATFHVGLSRRLFKDKDFSASKALGGDLIFGGVKLLLAKGRAIRYQTIFDEEQNRWISNQIGLDMDFGNGIALSGNYVNLARDRDAYRDKENLIDVAGIIRLTGDTALKGEWKNDISSEKDESYSVGILYEIPCFTLDISLYRERQTDRFESEGVREDSGIRFSFDIFTETSNESRPSILGGY